MSTASRTSSSQRPRIERLSEKRSRIGLWSVVLVLVLVRHAGACGGMHEAPRPPQDPARRTPREPSPPQEEPVVLPPPQEEPAVLQITEPVPAPSCERVACADASLVLAAENAPTVARARAIRGRLTDVSGAPLAGARLILIHASWDPPVQDEPPFIGPPPDTRPRLVARAVDLSGTDPQGQFLVREDMSDVPDQRFLIVEHPRGHRTVQLADASDLRIVLPPTVAVVVRAHAAPGVLSTFSSASIFWTGPDGEEEWSTTPMRPSSGEQVAPNLGLPYWPGAAWFAPSSASWFETRVDLPVGPVRITASVDGASNHSLLRVSSTGLSERSIDIEVPHPNGARLRLELSRPMNGHVSHEVWVWQYPETRRFASMSSRTVRWPVLMDLPPGRYFIGPGMLAEPACRQSIVLNAGDDQVVRIDGMSCVVYIRMPYD